MHLNLIQIDLDPLLWDIRVSHQYVFCRDR